VGEWVGGRVRGTLWVDGLIFIYSRKEEKRTNSLVLFQAVYTTARFTYTRRINPFMARIYAGHPTGWLPHRGNTHAVLPCGDFNHVTAVHGVVA